MAMRDAEVMKMQTTKSTTVLLQLKSACTLARKEVQIIFKLVKKSISIEAEKKLT